MPLAAIGVTHRLAPVALRELLHLDGEDAGEVGRRLATPACEAVVLATCNRTEIYLACPDPEAAAERACAELAGIAGLTREELDPVLEIRYGREACRAICSGSLPGSSSLVLGEGQILGQIRDAYAAALGDGTTGPLLNRLFHRALQAGKRVRTETSIGEKPCSVAGAAVELARRGLGGLAGRRILVLGAGKTGALTAEALASHGAGTIVVASRTRQGASSPCSPPRRRGDRPRRGRSGARADGRRDLGDRVPEPAPDRAAGCACDGGASRQDAPADRHRGSARSRSGDPNRQGLPAARHRRPPVARRREPRRPARRVGKGGSDRRRRARAVRPGAARARSRAADRVDLPARPGDPGDRPGESGAEARGALAPASAPPSRRSPPRSSAG